MRVSTNKAGDKTLPPVSQRKIDGELSAGKSASEFRMICAIFAFNSRNIDFNIRTEISFLCCGP